MKIRHKESRQMEAIRRKAFIAVKNPSVGCRQEEQQQMQPSEIAAPPASQRSSMSQVLERRGGVKPFPGSFHHFAVNTDCVNEEVGWKRYVWTPAWAWGEVWVGYRMKATGLKFHHLRQITKAPVTAASLRRLNWFKIQITSYFSLSFPVNICLACWSLMKVWNSSYQFLLDRLVSLPQDFFCPLQDSIFCFQLGNLLTSLLVHGPFAAQFPHQTFHLWGRKQTNKNSRLVSTPTCQALVGSSYSNVVFYFCHLGFGLLVGEKNIWRRRFGPWEFLRIQSPKLI